MYTNTKRITLARINAVQTTRMLIAVNEKMMLKKVFVQPRLEKSFLIFNWCFSESINIFGKRFATWQKKWWIGEIARTLLRWQLGVMSIEKDNGFSETG